MTRMAARMVCACGLALVPVLVPVPAVSAEYVTPDGLGYTTCHKPSSEEAETPCDQLPPEHLAATGFADYQPLDSADTPGAHAKNRRIELRLTDL